MSQLKQFNPKTILVVEDEPIVMFVIDQILAIAGFTVLPAQSAKEGLEQFSRFSDEIHLLIADCVLKDGSGLDVALQCASRSPTLRIIITSGRPPTVWDEGHVELFRQLPTVCRVFLQKPFSPGALLHAVNRAIGPPEAFERAAHV